MGQVAEEPNEYVQFVDCHRFQWDVPGITR